VPAPPDAPVPAPPPVPALPMPPVPPAHCRRCRRRSFPRYRCHRCPRRHLRRCQNRQARSSPRSKQSERASSAAEGARRRSWAQTISTSTTSPSCPTIRGVEVVRIGRARPLPGALAIASLLAVDVHAAAPDPVPTLPPAFNIATRIPGPPPVGGVDPRRQPSIRMNDGWACAAFETERGRMHQCWGRGPEPARVHRPLDAGRDLQRARSLVRPRRPRV
jgi:hypothetical protein